MIRFNLPCLILSPLINFPMLYYSFIPEINNCSVLILICASYISVSFIIINIKDC